MDGMFLGAFDWRDIILLFCAVVILCMMNQYYNALEHT